MNYKYLILLFSPFLLQAQEIEIKMLSKNINTNGSEFNFIQVNDKTAFYSSATLEGDEYQRTVIWEFPSFAEAEKCYNSKEYQNAWSLAKNTTERNLQVIEGFSIE